MQSLIEHGEERHWSLGACLPFTRHQEEIHVYSLVHKRAVA